MGEMKIQIKEYGEGRARAEGERERSRAVQMWKSGAVKELD